MPLRDTPATVDRAITPTALLECFPLSERPVIPRTDTIVEKDFGVYGWLFFRASYERKEWDLERKTSKGRCK